jgi:hypothetical protein
MMMPWSPWRQRIDLCVLALVLYNAIFAPLKVSSRDAAAAAAADDDDDDDDDDDEHDLL